MAEVVSNLARLDEATIRELEARLQELRDRRLREVEELGLVRKLETLLRAWGKCIAAWCRDKYWGTADRISVSRRMGRYEVFYHGELVLNYDPEQRMLAVFKPGTWLTLIEQLYQSAKLELAEKELREKIEELRRKAEALGVRLEDLICGSECEDAPF